MVGKIFACMLAVTIATAAFFAPPAQAQQNLVFGVHPFRAPADLAKMFQPLINYLQQETGAAISFRTAKDYDATLQALLAGEIHISYQGPSLYALAAGDHADRITLLGTVTDKAGSPTFQGVIIAKEDSPINSLADLKGKNFAFGDRESTLSCYIPAYMLMQEGIFDSIEYKFLGSHDNVARAVSTGIFAAGGLQPSVAQQYVGKGVKIIAESAPVYEHVLVASSSLDAALIGKLREAILKLKDPAVLDSIKKGTTGFAATKPEDYDNLREIMKAVDAKLPR